MSESIRGPFTHYNFSAATVAVANRFVTSTNMSLTPYTVANGGAMSTLGARHVSVTHTTVAGTDTLGTLVIVGTNLAGQTITETLTPIADSLVTGARWFNTVTSVTSLGWVAVSTADTIVVGQSDTPAVLDSAGVLYAVVVNTTAAGTVVLADASSTIATLKSSITENTYYYECIAAGYLTVALGAASNITVICSLPEKV